MEPTNRQELLVKLKEQMQEVDRLDDKLKKAIVLYNGGPSNPEKSNVQALLEYGFAATGNIVRVATDLDEAVRKALETAEELGI